MQGHWLSQTRKLNRHYQSGTGGRPRLILWQVLDGVGSYTSTYRLTPGVGDYQQGINTDLIIEPRRYKLCWDLKAYMTPDNIYVYDVIGIQYASITSRFYSNPYINALTNPPGGISYGQGFRISKTTQFTVLQNDLTDIQANIVNESQASSITSSDIWRRGGNIYGHYAYNPDYTTLSELLGRKITRPDGVILNTISTYNTNEEEERQAALAGLDPKYSNIYLDFTHLPAPQKVYTPLMNVDILNRDGTHTTTGTYRDPLISVCMYCLGTYATTGQLHTMSPNGTIWLEPL